MQRSILTRSLVGLLLASGAWSASRPAEAGQPVPAKTCEALKVSAGDEERAAAIDGRWARTSTGPIFRAAIINVRAQKRIQAQCLAEGRIADANQALLDAQGAVVDDYAVFVEYLGYRRALSDLEERRFDKQVGGGAANAGSTSIAIKGTVPSLLGFAVENGALLQSVSGTTMTFRASPMNVVKALVSRGYLESAPDPVPGTFASILSDLSLSASFDTNRGASPDVFTGDNQQLAGYSVHYQILNWRDPRNVRYARAWEAARTGGAAVLAARLNALAVALRDPSRIPPDMPRPSADTFQELEAWRTETSRRIANAALDDVATVITEQAEAFKTIVERSPAVMTNVAAAGLALVDYFVNRNEQIRRIAKSWVVAFDFSNTRQRAPDAGAALTAPAAGALTALPPPDLSVFTLVFGKGFSDGPELTGNIGATLFTNRGSGSTVGRLRDIQGSLQLDVPLPRINNIGGMVLSFGALFESLKEEPLGRPIVINTKEITTAGDIWLFQSKLSVPAGQSGLTIPISLTWSNRTELIIEEKTITRLNVGLTLDLDTLFAKP